jgi:hypothetical protein
MTPPNDLDATDAVQTDQVDKGPLIDVAATKRPVELLEILSETGRFDFDVISNASQAMTDDRTDTLRNKLVASVVE